MSQSSPIGQRSSATSPRSFAGTGTFNTSSSRPGTANTTKVGSLSGVPSAHNEPNGRYYERHQESPEFPAQTSARAFGVHSILNPEADDGKLGLTPASLTISGLVSAGQRSLPPAALSPRSRKRPGLDSPVHQQDSQSAHAGRRVLTPKSPTFRAASLGSRKPSAFQSIGSSLAALTAPEPRIYTAEPGVADVPSLPSLAIATRTPLSNVSAHDYPLYGSRQPRMASPNNVRPSASPRLPPVARPSPDQASPALRYGSEIPARQPAHPYSTLSTNVTGGYHRDPYGHASHDGYQTGPASYQMTLDTDQGPMVVPVELDLQQASKVADEKRKRNAGASARFRARRKEKEKEASTTISGLQHELRELTEERDFYRNERNLFRDLAARHLGSAQLPQRPPTPRAQRRSVLSTSSVEGSRSTEENYGPRSDIIGSAQRRRTGDYQPNFIHGAQSPPMPTYNPAYPTASPMSLAPLSAASGQYIPRSLPPGPIPPSSQPARSQSYDPFRKDPFDKSWYPGR